MSEMEDTLIYYFKGFLDGVFVVLWVICAIGLVRELRSKDVCE